MQPIYLSILVGWLTAGSKESGEWFQLYLRAQLVYEAITIRLYFALIVDVSFVHSALRGEEERLILCSHRERSFLRGGIPFDKLRVSCLPRLAAFVEAEIALSEKRRFDFERSIESKIVS